MKQLIVTVEKEIIEPAGQALCRLSGRTDPAGRKSKIKEVADLKARIGLPISEPLPPDQIRSPRSPSLQLNLKLPCQNPLPPPRIM